MGGEPLDANECTGGKGDLGKDQDGAREGKGDGKAKKSKVRVFELERLGRGGWVPGPQDGNLNLEPHPEDDELC